MRFLNLVVYASLLVSFGDCDILGKFVFNGNDKQDGSSYLSVYHQPDSIQFAPNPGPLSTDEVSRVLALSLGLSIPKDIEWNGLQAGNFFNRPKALMMFNIEGLPNDEKLHEKSRIPLKIAQAASTSEIMQFSSESNLPNHLNAVFEGESTVVSVSADEKISTSTFSNGKASQTAFWSEMYDSWRSVNGEGEVEASFNKHQILKRLSEILPAGFKYDEEKMVVSVNDKSIQLNLNLEDKAIFNFLSELVYMNWQSEEIELNRKVAKDSIPDVYIFTVSTLKNIERLYGSNSKQLKAAGLILKHFIPKIVERFVKLYDGKIFVAGVVIKSDISSMKEHKDKLQEVFETIKQNQYIKDLSDNIPELHVTEDLENQARSKLCEEVQGSVSAIADVLKFKCDTPDVHHVYRRSVAAAEKKKTDANDYNLASTYDDNFPVIFNIWFWLLVILFLAVYAISLSLWNMDPGRDSIIYRLTQKRTKSD